MGMGVELVMAINSSRTRITTCITMLPATDYKVMTQHPLFPHLTHILIAPHLSAHVNVNTVSHDLSLQSRPLVLTPFGPACWNL